MNRNEKVKSSHRKMIEAQKMQAAIAVAPKVKCPKCGTYELEATAFHVQYTGGGGAAGKKRLCGQCYVRVLVSQVPEMVPVTIEEFEAYVKEREQEEQQRASTLEEARKKRLEELAAGEKEKKTTEGA